MFNYPYVEVQISPTKKLNYLVELNTEKFELRKDGSYRFYHPQNMHDDVFWATALSLYATTEMGPEVFVQIIPMTLKKLRDRLRRRKFHGAGP
jgi:hypothetical protein